MEQTKVQELHERAREAKAQAKVLEASSLKAQLSLPEEPPTNTQIYDTLDVLRDQLELKKLQAGLSPTGKQIATDAQSVIDSTQKFLVEKNGDEQIQRLIVSSMAAAAATSENLEQNNIKADIASEGKNLSITTSLLKNLSLVPSLIPSSANSAMAVKEGARNLNKARQIVADMIQSTDLRHILIEFIDTMKELLDTANVNLEQAQSKVEDTRNSAELIGKMTESAVEKATSAASEANQKLERGLDKAEKFADDIEKGKIQVDMEQKLQQIRKRFVDILYRASQNKLYAQAVNNILDFAEEIKDVSLRLSAKASTTTEKLGSLPEVQDFLDDGRALLESFTSPANIDRLIEQGSNIIELIQIEPDMQSYFAELRDFLKKALKEPQMLAEQNSREIDYIFYRTTDIAKKAKSNIFLQVFLKTFKAIISDIVNDPTTSELLENTAKLAEDIFLDNQGNPVLKPEALQQLKLLITSLALEQLRDIPLPTISGSTDAYDYELSNLRISAWNILPANISFYSKTEINIDTEKNEQKASGRYTITMSDIRTQMRNVHFFIRRKGLFHLQDEGIADITLGKPGANITIDLEASTCPKESHMLFKVKSINLDLGNLQFYVVDSTYDWLLNLVSPIMMAAVKRDVQVNLERKLAGALSFIDSALYNFIKHSKVSSQIKETKAFIQDELSIIKQQKDAIENGTIVPPQ